MCGQHRQVNVPYSSALVASGGVPGYTYSISSGSLPGGLTLNPATGAITGTPTTAGTFNFTAKADGLIRQPGHQQHYYGLLDRDRASASAAFETRSRLCHL